MATLKELLKVLPDTQELAIPKKMLLDQAIREANKRKALSYAQRMHSLDQEERVFDTCLQRRPSKGKYKNRFSREEAGWTGTKIMGIRTSKNSVVVCQVRKDV